MKRSALITPDAREDATHRRAGQGGVAGTTGGGGDESVAILDCMSALIL